MIEKQKPIPVGVLVLYAAMLAVVFAPLMIGVPIIGAVMSSVVCAAFILCIIRWVNR
jgi:hypothetical protein